MPDMRSGRYAHIPVMKTTDSWCGDQLRGPVCLVQHNHMI